MCNQSIYEFSVTYWTINDEYERLTYLSIELVRNCSTETHKKLWWKYCKHPIFFYWIIHLAMRNVLSNYHPKWMYTCSKFTQSMFTVPLLPKASSLQSKDNIISVIEICSIIQSNQALFAVICLRFRLFLVFFLPQG